MEISWSLVLFSIFSILSSVTYIASAIAIEWRGIGKRYRVWSRLLSFILLVFAAVIIVSYLGHSERVFGIFKNPSSGLFWESVMIILTALSIAVYLIAIHRKAGESTIKVIASIGIIPAVILIAAVGYSYMLPGRPAWNTYILPVFLLAAAIAMACFCIYLFGVFCREPAQARFNVASLTAIAVQAAALIAYLAHVATMSYQGDPPSITRMLSGDLALLFWGGLVIPGFIVPAAVLIWGKVKKTASRAAAVLGFICMIAAVLCYFIILYSIGSNILNFGF